MLSRLLVKWFVASIVTILLCSTNLLAQDDAVPKYDVFVGYQWLHPGKNISTPAGAATTPPTIFRVHDMAAGFGASVARNFSRPLGFEVDFGHNWDNYETTLSAGPRVMLRTENANVFIHALLSYNRAGIDHFGSSDGVGGILGGGMDLKFSRRFSWRVVEADYLPTHHNFGVGLRPDFNGARLRTGLVWSLSYPESTPVSASVSVAPPQVMTGEPLTATARAAGFNPKHTLSYEWSSTCGKITGKGEVANIDTVGTPGGNCTTTVQVTDPQVRRNNRASASAGFTVQEPPKNPPVLSCSASPESVQAGQTARISCSCNSPDQVPVSVSNFTASSGTITGSGNAATLNTTDVAPGVVRIGATCTDQRGLSTSASTAVTVQNPPPPQVPQEVRQLEQRLALHSIYFATAQPTTAQPDGGLVASQQQTLTALAADFKKYLASRPDAQLILEGHTDPRGSAEYNQALSERRVNSTRHFLVAQGVPDANIQTKGYGLQQQLTAEQVKESVDQNTELTASERKRIMANMRTVILASNRRVDVRLSTTGQESVRQFPFNATDSLTLLGGRENAAPKRPKKAVPKK